VWLDSFICVTWLIHMRDMTHSYVWHDSFVCVTWQLNRAALSSHSSPSSTLTLLIHVWHDSLYRAALSSHSLPSSTSTCSIPRVEFLKSQLVLSLLGNDNADDCWELLASSLLRPNLPVRFVKYVCVYVSVYIYCLYLCMHGCLRINEILIRLFIYIYMHVYLGVRADEL